MALPYIPFHTVVETPGYLRAARDAGMNDAERAQVVDVLAKNPIAGMAIPEAGGCRKVRLPGRGKGKSGGYRVITFYSGPTLPVFLLTVFSKGDKSDLTPAERRLLAQTTARIAAAHRRKANDK